MAERPLLWRGLGWPCLGCFKLLGSGCPGGPVLQGGLPGKKPPSPLCWPRASCPQRPPLAALRPPQPLSLGSGCPGARPPAREVEAARALREVCRPIGASTPPLPFRHRKPPSPASVSKAGAGPGRGCSREQGCVRVFQDLPLGRTSPGPSQGWELTRGLCAWGWREGMIGTPSPELCGQSCFSILNSGPLSPPSQASLGITRSHPACVTERSLSSLSTPWRPPPCTRPAAAPTTTSRSPTKTSNPV